MRILITGSSGYVGNFLTEYFVRLGGQVVGLDLRPHPRQKNLPNFVFFECDVREARRCQRILTEAQPTHVVHLAYLMDPSHDQKFEYSVDVIGSQNIFRAVNEAKSVRQFINWSSASAYGARPSNPLWISEETALAPEDYVYGLNKKIVEEWIAAYPKRPDLKVVTFRMCTAVGPSYYKSGGVVATFTKAPLAISLSREPSQLQFIHEDDVTALTGQVVNDSTIEGVFNLAPDSFTTIQDLAASQNKPVLRLPRWLFRSIITLLWQLRLTDVSPPMVRLMAFSIIVSPKKIMERYQYVFKYTTLQAFTDAVKQRRAQGLL